MVVETEYKNLCESCLKTYLTGWWNWVSESLQSGWLGFSWSIAKHWQLPRRKRRGKCLHLLCLLNLLPQICWVSYISSGWKNSIDACLHPDQDWVCKETYETSRFYSLGWGECMVGEKAHIVKEHILSHRKGSVVCTSLRLWRTLNLLNFWLKATELQESLWT